MTSHNFRTPSLIIMLVITSNCTCRVVLQTIRQICYYDIVTSNLYLQPFNLFSMEWSLINEHSDYAMYQNHSSICRNYVYILHHNRDYIASRSGMSNSNFLAGRKSNKNCWRGRKSAQKVTKFRVWNSLWLKMTLSWNEKNKKYPKGLNCCRMNLGHSKQAKTRGPPVWHAWFKDLISHMHRSKEKEKYYLDHLWLKNQDIVSISYCLA